jgi:hypothetical protein
VNHAVDLATLPGNYRNHEALVTDGDEFLLQHAFFVVCAQEALERFLYGLLLPLDVTP